MRIQSIDTFKALAILAVVVIHTEPFLAIKAFREREYWYCVGNALQQVSSFAIPFFFIAAGYFFSQGIETEGLQTRWQRYVSRLSTLLLIWIVIDGIFWGHWLEEIIRSKSLSPLFWNLRAIPSFAVNRPDLFFFRGTAVPLWFLISLILSISLLALCIRLAIRPTAIIVIGCCAYIFSLMTSFYSSTPLGIGLTLPLEQRGPFIAFAFLAIGHFFAMRNISVRSSALVLAAAVVVVFVESAALSYAAGLPFQEKPYLFSTVLLAGSAFLFAIQHPAFGARSLVSKVGNRSLGIYLVHTPILGAASLMRGFIIHPAWEVFFPIAVLTLSYLIVTLLVKVPYLRVIVL